MITFLAISAVVVGLPVLTYLVVKFGATAYFRTKRREDKQNNQGKQ